VRSPAPGILDRVPDDLRGKLPDELVDELLAGARTEEEIMGQQVQVFACPLAFVVEGEWRRHDVARAA
jgi:hypothetical protein